MSKTPLLNEAPAISQPYRKKAPYQYYYITLRDAAISNSAKEFHYDT
jgi:hypothetical protein